MHRIARHVDFCYGHRLPGHAGACRHLHGHNATAEFHLESEQLDARSMVADFEEVGRRLQEWIDARLDHRMILRRDDPLAETLRAAGEPVVLLAESPTAEVLARHLFEAARALDLPVVEVRLWETARSVAVYRPC